MRRQVLILALRPEKSTLLLNVVTVRQNLRGLLLRSAGK